MQELGNVINLKELILSIRHSYKEKSLNRFDYLSAMHNFNKILLVYSKLINNSLIDKIEINQEGIIFYFEPLNIALITDGAARSAPFEILNFESYEPEDEAILYSLLKNSKNLFDIGANIGWYSVNFAKRFPSARVFSFEPIPTTFNFLQKNVILNGLENIEIFDCGLADEEKLSEMFYFQGGSAVASMKNLLDRDEVQKVECSFKTLDQVVSELGLDSLDFIKCDVEGSELYVLRGAQNVIKRFNPIFLVELCEEWCKKFSYSPGDVFALFSNSGYYGYRSTKIGLKRVKEFDYKDDGKYNYFFLHRERHDKIISDFSF